jgi:hypothetical protein
MAQAGQQDGAPARQEKQVVSQFEAVVKGRDFTVC